MKKLLILGIAVLGVAAMGCRQQHPPKDPAQKAAWLDEKLAEHLHLDADQKARALPILRSLVDERESWRGEGKGLLEDVRIQVAAESFDQDALNMALGQREKHLSQSRQKLVAKLAELQAILKPEQRKKAAEALGKLEDHMQKWGSRT